MLDRIKKEVISQQSHLTKENKIVVEKTDILVGR